MADDAGQISVQITAQIDGLMSGLNQATNGVKTATAEMADSFSGVKGESTQAFEQMAGQSKVAAESMEGDFSRTEARHAAHMLGMNRAVGGFLSHLSGVGAVMAAAFTPLAIMESIKWITEGAEKVREFHKEMAEMAETIASDWAKNTFAIEDQTAKLDVENAKLENQIDKLTGQPVNNLKVAILEDVAAVIQLANETETANNKIDALLKKDEVSEMQALGQTIIGMFTGDKPIMATTDQTELVAGYTKKLSEAKDTYARSLAMATTAEEKDAASKEYAAERHKLLTDAIDKTGKAYEALKAQAAVGKGVDFTAGLATLLGAQTDFMQQQGQGNAESKHAQLSATAGSLKDNAPGKAEKTADYSSEEMAQFKAALESKKDEEQNWFTWSIAAEIKYWQDKLDCTVQGSKLADGITAEIGKLKKKQGEEGEKDLEKSFDREYAAAKEGSQKRVALAGAELARIGSIYGAQSEQYKAMQAKLTEAQKQAADKRRADEIAAIQEKKTLDLTDLDSGIQVIRDREAAGLISKQKLLDAERAYVKAKYAIELQALQDEKALLLAGGQDVASEDNQILKLAQQLQTQLAALDKKGAADRNATFKAWTNGLTSGFHSAISGMIQGTQNFSQAFRSIMGSALDFAITQVWKTLSAHIAAEIDKTTATATGATTREGIETAAAHKSIMKDAKTAATKSYNWGASWGGPVAGAIAAALAFAGVMAFDSFETGGLVNKTGLIFAHQGEGVLTAPTLSMLRTVNAAVNRSGGAGAALSAIHSGASWGASGRGAMQPAAAGGGSGDVHLHINGCFDPKTFFNQHQGQILSTIKEGVKNRRV